MKKLLLCRHAKSSWKDLALRDVDRPLNKRGKRDAPEMGGRLKALGIRPDMIVTSPAVRARKTAKQLARALGYKKSKVRVIVEVYAATAEELLRVVRDFDDRDDLVILVGHNPETTALANIIGDLEIEIDNVPTCGIVGLDFAVASWKEVGKARGTLAFFDYPRKRTTGRRD